MKKISIIFLLMNLSVLLESCYSTQNSMKDLKQADKQLKDLNNLRKLHKAEDFLEKNMKKKDLNFFSIFFSKKSEFYKSYMQESISGMEASKQRFTLLKEGHEIIDLNFTKQIKILDPESPYQKFYENLKPNYKKLNIHPLTSSSEIRKKIDEQKKLSLDQRYQFLDDLSIQVIEPKDRALSENLKKQLNDQSNAGTRQFGKILNEGEFLHECNKIKYDSYALDYENLFYHRLLGESYKQLIKVVNTYDLNLKRSAYSRSQECSYTKDGRDYYNCREVFSTRKDLHVIPLWSDVSKISGYKELAVKKVFSSPELYNEIIINAVEILKQNNN